MGESGIHVKRVIAIVTALESHYRRRADVYVGANMFVYYDPADPALVVCPDVFVAFGVSSGERRTWKVWEEGKAPDVVFELTSKSTRKEDQYTKPAIYEELAVGEYFLFDPLGEYLRPSLQGFRLTADGYQPLAGERLASGLLGLELSLEGNHLRFSDPSTGSVLRAPAEYEDLARAAEARATATEEEARRLRQELERLRRGQ